MVYHDFFAGFPKSKICLTVSLGSGSSILLRRYL